MKLVFGETLNLLNRVESWRREVAETRITLFDSIDKLHAVTTNVFSTCDVMICLDHTEIILVEDFFVLRG
jgi:hypothetical protein